MKNNSLTPVGTVTPKGDEYAEQVLKELQESPDKPLIGRPAYGRLRGRQAARSMDVLALEELR